MLRRISTLGILLLTIILLIGATSINPNSWIEVTVTKVKDGNTIYVIYNGEETEVKLIGLNAPRLLEDKPEPYAQEAKDFIQQKLKDIKKVYLELDKDERDKDGRLLAYVWLDVPPNKADINVKYLKQYMLNAMLLAEGLAKATEDGRNTKYEGLFKDIQSQAIEEGKNIWEQESKNTATQSDNDIIVYITETGSKYHKAGCRYLKESSIPITLKKAKELGYEPCSVCKPPR